MPSSILVVGSANMDLVVSVGRYPKPGETIFGRTFGMFPGGKGANQAVCLAKLGADVRFLGKVGGDVFGRTLASGMKKDGVQMEALLLDKQAPTGTALITIDEGGQNEIVVISGANMKLTPGDIRKQQKLFAASGIVLLQLEIPLETVEEAVRLARTHKARTILNPAPACELSEALLKKIDFLTPNETELELLTGRAIKNAEDAAGAARELLARGVGTVIVTLGECGCLCVSQEGVLPVPARRVKALDTTAAGDAFTGGFAYGLSRNWNVEASLRFASDVAAYAVTKMGAQASMPGLGALKRFRSSLV